MRRPCVAPRVSAQRDVVRREALANGNKIIDALVRRRLARFCILHPCEPYQLNWTAFLGARE